MDTDICCMGIYDINVSGGTMSKQYLISEEELRDLIKIGTPYTEKPVLTAFMENKLKNFLEPKKPVETLNEDRVREILEDLVISTLADSDGCLIFKTDYEKYIKKLLALSGKSIDRNSIIKAIKKFGDKINYPVLDRYGDYMGSSGSGYELDEADLKKIADTLCKENDNV